MKWPGLLSDLGTKRERLEFNCHSNLAHTITYVSDNQEISSELIAQLEKFLVDMRDVALLSEEGEPVMLLNFYVDVLGRAWEKVSLFLCKDEGGGRTEGCSCEACFSTNLRPFPPCHGK